MHNTLDKHSFYAYSEPHKGSGQAIAATPQSKVISFTAALTMEEMMMAKFSVYAKVVFFLGEFEAETVEEAIKLAEDKQGAIDVVSAGFPAETQASIENITAEEIN